MEVQALAIPRKACGYHVGLPICHKAYVADKCLQGQQHWSGVPLRIRVKVEALHMGRSGALQEAIPGEMTHLIKNGMHNIAVVLCTLRISFQRCSICDSVRLSTLCSTGDGGAG